MATARRTEALAAAAKTLANLSRIPGLNPLNLDVEMFVDRKVPFLDET